MARAKHRRAGFTLVELLIVIIIIGILAAIAVPQFTNSTLDAKESTLVSNLATLRNAIELYYHQHSGKYPGAVDDTDGSGAPADATAAAAAFVNQLTQYTNKDGKASTTLDRTTYPFGPYLRTGVPANPLPDADASSVDNDGVTVASGTGSISADGASATTGWKFNSDTGQLIANSDDTSSDGVLAYSAF